MVQSTMSRSIGHSPINELCSHVSCLDKDMLHWCGPYTYFNHASRFIFKHDLTCYKMHNLFTYGVLCLSACQRLSLANLNCKKLLYLCLQIERVVQQLEVRPAFLHEVSPAMWQHSPSSL